MWRRALQIAAVLLGLHAAITFVVAFTVFPGAPFERMAFAQHGFNFAFLALLNIQLLRGRAAALHIAVLVANLIFCVDCAVFAVIRPEPPLVVAFAVSLISTIAAIGFVRVTPRTT